MSTTKRRGWWRGAVILLAVLLVAGASLFFVIRRRLPPGFSKDIQAGLAARPIKDADARLNKYHEGRYGPQSDPSNREKVFLGYFDVDHIKAMQLMVKHSPEAQRPGTIQAAARWVENYRNSLTPEERAGLSAQFRSPEGVNMLRRATAQYNSQDVKYRGQTAPVISQLLKTISSLQNP